MTPDDVANKLREIAQAVRGRLPIWADELAGDIRRDCVTVHQAEQEIERLHRRAAMRRGAAAMAMVLTLERLLHWIDREVEAAATAIGGPA